MRKGVLARAWAVATILLTMMGGAARAGESYYVLIFGAQSHPKQLRYTHTWATFVRAVDGRAGPGGCAIQAHTISWLPRTLEVKVWRPWPEPGVNLDLDQSFAAVYAHNEHVTMWGPFVIRRELYERSLQVLGMLNSGVIQYRAISGPANLLISDCIHAVAAVDPIFGRGHYPLIRVGKPASRYIARQIMLRSVFDQARYDNSWLIPRLGLDRYPIEVVPPWQIPRRGCVLCQCPE